jgi:hypothetical protein
MADEDTMPGLFYAICAFVAGIILMMLPSGPGGCRPVTQSCHHSIADCEAFCAPRGGVERVETRNSWNCLPSGDRERSRTVLCECKRP